MSSVHEKVSPQSIEVCDFNGTVIQTRALRKHIPASGEQNADMRDLLILQDINLSVQAGESVAITGTSGSGKSTLLGLLAGLDTPSGGALELFGEDLAQQDEDQRAKARLGKVGFVFQSFHLLENLTALENVMLPLELGSKRTDIRQLSETALEQVGLAERKNHLVNRLSGGEQQRVALARAFVTQPAILFADEPTGNLDKTTGQEVADLLFKMQKEGKTTLVLVTHDETLAAQCDSWYRLDAGELVAEKVLPSLTIVQENQEGGVQKTLQSGQSDVTEQAAAG